MAAKSPLDAPESLALRGLIRECDLVLDNPVLMAMVEYAGSLTYLDSAIVKMGWPNELGKQVRETARLRKRLIEQGKQSVWEELSKPTLRPADALLEFSSHPLLTGICVSTSFKFGRFRRDTTAWPLFLREFRMGDGVTTIDCRGSDFSSGNLSLTREVPTSYVQVFKEVGDGQTGEYVYELGPRKLMIHSRPFNPPEYTLTFGDITITGGNVFVKPYNNIPGLVKTLIIEKYLDQDKQRKERISIAVTQDMGPRSYTDEVRCQIGMVKLERLVNLPPYFQMCFERQYAVIAGGHLLYEREGYPLWQTSLLPEAPNAEDLEVKDLQSIDHSHVVQEFVDFTRQLIEAPRKPSLKMIAGEGLLNFKGRLSDLFTDPLSYM